MEPPEAVEVRLSDVCRSCLLKTDDMINFSYINETTSEIIAMLSSIGKIEIQISDFLPSYLCKTCEEKLRLSYDFQMLIQRSNEIIRECIGEMEMVSGEEIEKGPIKEEDAPATVNPEIKAPRKLLEFSPSEVQEAINEYKEKFYLNIECIKCGFVTSNSRSLSVHMSHLHKDVKDYWCSICNAEVVDLSEHIVTHTEDLFKCKLCGKKLNTKGHLYEHLRSHSSVKPHVCYICCKEFIGERQLENHVRVHLNSRVHKCSLCPSSFSTRNSFRAHYRNHLVKIKSGAMILPEVAQIKIDSPQNFCKICKKRVRSLEDHIQKCHSKRPKEKKDIEAILCTHCGKQFSRLSRFRIHMRTHTGETPYKCQYCEKRMATRNHLVLHERTHTGEKPYVCNICGRAFSQSSVLNTHMKIHTGRPEVCEICSKRFCRPAQLRLHMRKHTGEKPYQCTECDQAFKQQSHLSEHLKRHSDERPYKCLHCVKSFKQMSILKSHMTIHTGEKPFKCSQCHYACRQRYSLTQHMRQHSTDAPDPDKPHVCNLCQKGYSTMAMLMSHNNLVHSE